MEGLSWKRLLRAASAGPLLQVRKLRMWPRGAAASEQLPGCLSPHAGASSHLWAAALDLCPEVTTALAYVPQASGQRRPPPWLSCLPLSPFTLFYVLLPGCACKCSHVHCGSSICLTRRGGLALFPHLCPAWTEPLDERTKLCKPCVWYVSFTSLPSVAQCKERQCCQTLRASPGCCSSISMGVRCCFLLSLLSHRLERGSRGLLTVLCPTLSYAWYPAGVHWALRMDGRAGAGPLWSGATVSNHFPSQNHVVVTISTCQALSIFSSRSFMST